VAISRGVGFHSPGNSSSIVRFFGWRRGKKGRMEEVPLSVVPQPQLPQSLVVQTMEKKSSRYSPSKKYCL